MSCQTIISIGITGRDVVFLSDGNVEGMHYSYDNFYVRVSDQIEGNLFPFLSVGI